MELIVFGYKLNVVYLIIIGLLLFFINLNTLCSCSGGIHKTFNNLSNVVETMSNISGAELHYKIGDGVKNSWDNSSNMNDRKCGCGNKNCGRGNKNCGCGNKNCGCGNKKCGCGNKNCGRGNKKCGCGNKNCGCDLYNNKEKNGKINLLGFFNKNTFSADCCPSNYTNSHGCLCISKKQSEFLNKRGGNRTLNSVY